MKMIKSISKGYGEDSEFFSTDEKHTGHPWFVHEIKEETKTIGEGYHNDLTLTVYRGYEYPDKEPVFEIEANSALTITFKPQPTKADKD